MPETKEVVNQEDLERDYIANPLTPDEVSPNAQFPEEGNASGFEQMAKTPVEGEDFPAKKETTSNSENLYNGLNKAGKYTKSFEEFQNQFSTPEKQVKLYEALNKSGDYTKSQDEFINQFFSTPSEDVKKKDKNEVSSEKAQDTTTDSASTSGDTASSLESQQENHPDYDKVKALIGEDADLDINTYLKLKSDYEKEKAYKSYQYARVGNFIQGGITLPKAEPVYETDFENKAEAFKEMDAKYKKMITDKYISELPQDQQDEYRALQNMRDFYEDYQKGAADSPFNMQGDWLDRATTGLSRFVVEGLSFGQISPEKSIAEIREERRAETVKLMDDFVTNSIENSYKQNQTQYNEIKDQIDKLKTDNTIDDQEKLTIVDGLIATGARLERQMNTVSEIGDALYGMNHKVQMGHIETMGKSFSNVITSMPRQSASLIKMATSVLGNPMDAETDTAEDLYKYFSSITDSLQYELDPTKPISNEIGAFSAVIVANAALAGIGGTPLAVGYMGGMTHDEMYSDLRMQNKSQNLGLTDKEMLTAANIYAPIATGVFFGVGAGNTMTSGAKKQVADEFIKFIIKNRSALEKAGDKGLWTAAKENIMNKVIQMNAGGLEMTAAMTTNQIINMGLKDIMNNSLELNGKIELAPGGDIEESLKHTVFSAYVSGAVLKGLSTPSKTAPRFTFAEVESSLMDPVYVNKIKSALSKKLENKSMSKKTYDQILERLNEDVETVKSINPDLNETQREKASELISEKRMLLKEIEGKEGVQSKKDRIKELDKQLDELAEFASDFEKEMEAALEESDKTPVKETSDIDPLEIIDEAKEFTEASDIVAKKKPINEKKLERAIEEGYDTLDKIEKDKRLSDRDKEIATEIVEGEIEKLESYEQKTKTTVRKVANTEKVRGIRESKRKQRKSPQERILSRKVRRVEGDKFFETVKDVPDTQKGKTKKATKGVKEEVTTLEREGNEIFIQEYDAKGNKTIRQKLTAEKMEDFELVETIKDENGVVTGAILRNKNNKGEAFAIEDAEIALDLAEQKTKAELGEIKDIEINKLLDEIEYVETPIVPAKKNTNTAKQKTPSNKQTTPKSSNQTSNPQNNIQKQIKRAALKRLATRTKDVLPKSQDVLSTLINVQKSKLSQYFKWGEKESSNDVVRSMLELDTKKFTPEQLADYYRVLDVYAKTGKVPTSFGFAVESGNQNAIKLAAKLKDRPKRGTQIGDLFVYKLFGNIYHMTNRLLRGLKTNDIVEFITKSGLGGIVEKSSKVRMAINKSLPLRDEMVKIKNNALAKRKGNYNFNDAKFESQAAIMGSILSPAPVKNDNYMGWLNTSKRNIKIYIDAIKERISLNTDNKILTEELTGMLDAYEKFYEWYKPTVDGLEAKYGLDEINKPIDKNHPIFKEMKKEYKGTAEFKLLMKAIDLFKSIKENTLDFRTQIGKTEDGNDLYTHTSYTSKGLGKESEYTNEDFGAFNQILERFNLNQSSPLTYQAFSLKNRRPGGGLKGSVNQVGNRYLNGSSFISNQFRAFDAAAKEAFMGRDIAQFKAFMNNKDFIKYIGNEKKVKNYVEEVDKAINYRNVKDAYALQLSSKTPSGRRAIRLGNFVRKSAYRVLYGVAQRFKQSTQTLSAAVTSTEAFMSNAKILAEGGPQKDAMVSFFVNNSEAASRNLMNIIDAGFGSRAGKIDGKFWEGANKLDQAAAKFSITDADFLATFNAWTAAYRHYRTTEGGIRNKDFLWSKELRNPNKAAKSFAQFETGLSQGASLPEFTADFIKDPSMTGKAVRMFILPYSSFMGQMKMSYWTDLAQVGHDPRAARRLLGYTAAITGYQVAGLTAAKTIGTGVFKAATYFLLDDGTKESEQTIASLANIREQAMDTYYERITKGIFKDAFMFPVPPAPLAEAAVLSATNYGVYQLYNMYMGNIFENQEEFKALGGPQFPVYAQDYNYLLPEAGILYNCYLTDQIIEDGYFTYINKTNGSESIQKLTKRDKEMLSAINVINYASVILMDQNYRSESSGLKRNYTKKLYNLNYYKGLANQGEFGPEQQEMLLDAVVHNSLTGRAPQINSAEKIIATSAIQGQNSSITQRANANAIMQLEALLNRNQLSEGDAIRLQQLLDKRSRILDKLRTEAEEEQ